MRTAAWVLVGLGLFAAGCSRAPEPGPPPDQRAPLDDAPLERLTFIDLTAPASDRFVVRDILKAAEPNSIWRWTNQNPTVRVRLAEPAAWKMRVDFAVADATFGETGPITIQFTVNEKVLDTVRYSKPGEISFEKAVPDGWLRIGQENTAGAQIDKVYVAKADGMKLGILLMKIGFVK